MAATDFLGRSWGFPVSPDARGRMPIIKGPASVQQSMLLILETEPGERLMRPDFGCGLRRFLMKPNTVATRALIQREVGRALRQWERRIELTSVEVTPGQDPSLVTIRIDYVHTRDQRPGNLVYPFYLE